MAGVITELKVQTRAKDRVNVSIDGRFAFGLALIHALWLKIGQQLSDEQIAELQAADTLEKAQQRALNFIAYRPRTVKEVRTRMKRAGVDDASIETVVDRLHEVGLLDDSAFSATWVESRLRNSPRGKRMISYELKQKGVSEEQIKAVLANVNDEDAATRAAQKRLPRLAGLEPRERKRKLMEYLARNGFAYDAIEQALQTVLASRADDAEDSTSEFPADSA